MSHRYDEIVRQLDWTNKFDFHSDIVDNHEKRVANSARKVAPQIFERSISEQTRILTHPEFYNFLLFAIRERRTPLTEQVESLVHLILEPKSIVGRAIDLICAGPQIEFTTKEGDVISDYSESEQTEVEKTLASAFAELEKLNSKAHRFVTSVVRTIVCRRRKNLPYFYTSSQITHIGRVTFDNILEFRPKLSDVVNGLVHEAIHSFLYMIEESGRFLTPTQNIPAQEIRVSSPWTTNSICLHSFVHAAYVWFSLKTLWPKGSLRSLEKTVRDGFAHPGFREILDTNTRQIDGELRRSLVELANREALA